MVRKSSPGERVGQVGLPSRRVMPFSAEPWNTVPFHPGEDLCMDLQPEVRVLYCAFVPA